MSTRPNDNTPLGTARRWLRDRVDEGERCPCCTQLAKVYRRALNAGMARALIAMYRAGGTDWIHKPTVLKGLGSAARDESILRYWGLLEEEKDRRPDGGRSGWWRVTDAGEEFVLGATTVPKHARIYDGRCLGLDPESYISIKDALGNKFDYDALMRGE